MTLLCFHAADIIGDRFLALLQSKGIHPPVGSNLEDELLSLTQLIEVMKNPSLASRSDQVSILRSAAGLHDLAAKILAVESIPEFATFIPHLRMISETRVRPASLGQNDSSCTSDDTARKFAELYIGSLAAHVGTEVVLDSPTNAKGDNPDIMFTLQECDSSKSPQRWALAIKTISSRHGQTIFERIKEGAEQIDSAKCSADFGIVIINAKSSLNHEALWNTQFSDLDQAIDALDTQLQSLIDQAADYRPQNEWDDLFRHKVVRPVLFLGQSLVGLPNSSGTRIPIPLKVLKAYGANGKLNPIAYQLALQMNEHMQIILSGVPGTCGTLPY